MYILKVVLFFAMFCLGDFPYFLFANVYYRFFIAENFTESIGHVVAQYHQRVCGLRQVSIRAPIHWMMRFVPIYSICYKSGV